MVEHRAVTREGVSSTPAGPALKFLKSYLCNYIRKCLHFQVFSDKDYKPVFLVFTHLMKRSCWCTKQWQMSLKFCIIIEPNSQKTYFAFVLYTNMAAVTSRENREYGQAFCVSPLQIATADTDTMAAIEICAKREDMRVFSEIYRRFTAITVE